MSKSKSAQNSSRQPADDEPEPSTSGGATRDQRRAYDHQQSKLPWSEQRELESRPNGRRGKQSARSKSWKDKKNEGSAADEPFQQKDDKKNKPDFRAKKEAKEDDSNFDFGPFEASLPTLTMRAQNFDHSGFVTLVESVYEELQGLDPRISRIMPFSMFLHAMVNVQSAHLMDTATHIGRSPLPDGEYVSEMFGEDVLIPSPIYEYLQSYGKATIRNGTVIFPNLPPIAVPSNGEDNAVAGTFGPITVRDHNKYECYIAPYVTMRRVIASRDSVDNWEPLPQYYAPENSQPTGNLLGYGIRDILTPEGRSRLVGLNFIDDGSPAARLCFSPDLFGRVQVYLENIAGRFKMVKMPQVQGRSGTRIPLKMSHTTTEFVEYTGSRDSEILRLMNPNVLASQSFGRNTATAAAIFAHHRRRTINSPGPCYIRDGASIPGWRQFRNSNFEMNDDFRPVHGYNDSASSRVDEYFSNTSRGYSSQLYKLYVSRYVVKKK